MKKSFTSFPFGKMVTRCLILVLFVVQGYVLSAQNITVRFDGVTVEKALEMLKNDHGYSFVFKSKDLDLDRKVNAEFASSDIKDVLAEIFKGQRVVFEINGKLVHVVRNTVPVKNTSEVSSGSYTSGIIKGKITDKTGFPLVGVGIVIKGTLNGVVSDARGNYEIEASEGDILQYICLGYDTEEIEVGKSRSIDIAMAEQMNNLEESVVIGYGVMKKSDLTGAVASVKAKDLPMSSNTSIAQMLSGRATGVSATQNSAQPGGGVEILVRGAASTGAGNEPLYIIDGFPVSGASVEPASDNRYSDFGSRNPLNSINPNDIESIEVLKDASSTAIYGARAANGVIIITTKKGKEGKATVSYNVSYGVQKIANRIEMMTAEEFMREANSFTEEKWYYDNRIYPYGNTDPATVTEKLILPYKEDQIRNAGAGTDWYGMVTQNGMIHQHNLSVSGGTSNLKYMASFNFYDQNGVVKHSDFTRYSGRINIEHKVGKYFTYGINATQSFIRSSNIPLGTEDFENSGLLNSALAYDPTVPVKDKDGNFCISPLMTTVPNPVSMLEIDDYTDSKRLLVNAFLQLEPIKGLSFKVNMGFDNQTGTRNSYIPKTTLYGKQEGGKASKSTVNQMDKLIEVTANYNLNVKDRHKLNILVGYSWQNFMSDGLSASNSQFFTDQFGTNSLGSGENQRPFVGSSKSENVLMSYFGRINYNLFDKYLFTFTARVDGSSKFGKNNRYGFFPSGAFAWKLKQEPFLIDFDPLSELKLRLSFGQTGNSNIGNNAFEYYTAAWHQYVFGSGVSTGTAKSQLANPDLKWETTTELNIGLDFGFFDQRLSGSFEYFNKEVKDLLGFRSLKSFMEVDRVASNIGKTKSTGFELTLHSRIL